MQFVEKIGDETYIAPNAAVVGDVTLGKNVSVLFGAVIRADRDSVTIGDCSNVQDNAVIHESSGRPVRIGNYVSIGHGAIVHGAEVEDGCLIGMGAILLNGSKIGKGSLIAAGAVVTENKIIPPNSLVMGVPGKVVRSLTEDEIAANKNNAIIYTEVGRKYLNNEL